MADLERHHCLVTGAGSGIGMAIARGLWTAGARVSLAGRRREPLQQLADELGSERSLAIGGFDITDPDAIKRGLEAARAKFGPLSILVNNAGQAHSAAFEKTTRKFWDEIIAVDLTGVFDMTQAVLADLKGFGDGARIINIASTAGLKGYGYVSAYCAAKHGVIGLTRSLAMELATSDITVNAICPGFTDTPMVAQSLAVVAEKTKRSKQDILAQYTKVNPQGRLIDPDEIAEAVLYLASPAARSLTGQAIAIAGGEIM